MLIGILQTGHTPDEVHSHHGDFDCMFARLLANYGFTFQTWNVADMDFPTSIDDAQGWLITGSKHGAYENHTFIPPLETFIRDLYRGQKPTVGICFGHQIIAQALGGRVEKYAGGWALGRHQYTDADLGTIHLNAWHQDQVITLPPHARRTARSPFCENAGLVYGTCIYTLQPHPELSNPIIADYVKIRRTHSAYPTALMDIAEKQTCLANDEQIMAGQIAAFLKGEFIPKTLDHTKEVL